MMITSSLTFQGGFSLHHYRNLFADPRTIDLLVRSVGMAFGATFLTVAFGLPLAICLARATFPGRRMCSVIYLTPLFIPPHVHALAWIYLLTETNGQPAILYNIYSPAGSACLLFLAYCPLFILFVVTGISLIDTRLEEAARLHGGRLKMWKNISLPLSLPYILSGTVFVFLFSFFDYGVPSMLRVSTFPVEIFVRFSGYYDEAGATALSLPLVVVAMVLLMLQRKIMAGTSLVTIHNGCRLNSLTNRHNNRLAAIFVWSFIALTSVAPLVALILQAGKWQSFRTAFLSSAAEIQTSVVLAALAASLASLLGYCLARYIREQQSKWRELVDTLSLLPFAFPAALCGIGLIHLWNQDLTMVLYSSSGIVILAFIARFIPFAIRIIAANLQQISPTMYEAALICQPSRWKRLFIIELPLARRGIWACWVIVFIFSMGELGATLLVIPPGLGTVSLKIYTLMHYGVGPLVAALALILVGINLVFASSLLMMGANK